MSLIEQAAKRLEELKRAGAASGDGVPATSSEDPRPSAAAHVPTPEAVVHALGARGVEPMLSPARADAAGRVEPHVAPPPGVAPHIRHADIDIERLRALGYVTPDMPEAQIADEFRVIKRPILRNARASMATRGARRNLVMVTSALPGEGKTFTALNLAVSVAMELDNTVLLVDGDVAHPALPELLGVPASPGLLDLLTRRDVDVADALVKTNIEKLTVLPAGSRHRRATELLASEQMASLLAELSSRYSDRIIVFDSPPLLPTTEARVLASHMGQVIMVVAADSTTQHAVNLALATIESCEVVLMMLNKADKTDVGTYYGYGYGGDGARH